MDNVKVVVHQDEMSHCEETNKMRDYQSQPYFQTIPFVVQNVLNVSAFYKAIFQANA